MKAKAKHETGGGGALAFEVSSDEVRALQSIGRQIAQLGNRMEQDQDFARKFLQAAVQCDRTALTSLCGGKVKPDHLGSVERTGPEIGVMAASCQLRFNMDRFRLFLGLEER
jgi:hypothetical protein